MSEKLPPPVGRARPFPWPCIECREKEIFPLVTDFTIEAKHDGRLYDVRIPDLVIPTCRNCGEQVFTSAEDERIRDALRTQIGLFTSQEIRAHRVERGLNQQELAEALGVAKETISRWETGAIQSRAMDNLLRLFFESEEVRGLLRRQFKEPAAVPVNRIKWPRFAVEASVTVEFGLHVRN